MSRVSLIEKLYTVKKSPLEFHYEKLWAPPVMSIFSPSDINDLIYAATSPRLNGNILKKREYIDQVMKRRRFYRFSAGTNRIVYKFSEDPTFVAKVAMDKVGMKDSPREYLNQRYFMPFCTKIFQPIPSGVINFAERVDPIQSVEEMLSVADDIFNLIISVVIGRCVVDDLGNKSYMNYGVRRHRGFTFGPVLLDFPYVYELDGAKLICRQRRASNLCYNEPALCGGEIDYDVGFNKLYCPKCGKEYTARELAKDDTCVQLQFDSCDRNFLRKYRHTLRARVVDNGKILYDSGRSSDHYISRKEFEQMSYIDVFEGENFPREVRVDRVIRSKGPTTEQLKQQWYTDTQRKYYESVMAKNAFNNISTSGIAESVNHSVRQQNPIVNQPNQAFVGDDDYPINQDTVVTVNNTIGGPIELDDNYVYVIEREIIPEMSNVVEPVKPETLVQANAIGATKYGEQFTHPAQVVSDEVVSHMVEEVKDRIADKVEEVKSYALNPDEDKNNPQKSPFTRPYGNAPYPVNVDNNTREAVTQRDKYYEELEAEAVTTTIEESSEPVAETDSGIESNAEDGDNDITPEQQALENALRAADLAEDNENDDEAPNKNNNAYKKKRKNITQVRRNARRNKYGN